MAMRLISIDQLICISYFSCFKYWSVKKSDIAQKYDLLTSLCLDQHYVNFYRQAE